MSTMLLDLIKVNLQKEIPKENQTDQLTDLQSQQYLTSFDQMMLQSTRFEVNSRDIDSLQSKNQELTSAMLSLGGPFQEESAETETATVSRPDAIDTETVQTQSGRA